jgi:hypothetical protein
MSKKKTPDTETVTIPEFDPASLPLSCTWIIIGPPASGKCLGENTPVLMYDGNVFKVQDICTGDYLMGDDSSPRRVLSITSGTDKLYRITPLKGDPYVVNGPHVLCLRDENSELREITTSEYFSSAERYRYKGYRTAVEFHGRLIPQGAYSFGSNMGGMLVFGPARLYRHDEFMCYAVNTREIRSLFFAGILDTSSIKECGCAKLTCEVEELGRDVMFLARSLGFKCWKEQANIYISGMFSKIPTRSFMCEDDVTDLTYDFEIEYIGEGKYYGFELDGNHRFLLGDFTVTHNTSLMENLAYYRKHVYPTARVFIGTEDGYKRFCKIFHPLYVSNYWDEKEEEKHVLRQRTCEMENGRGYPGNYAVNIIDDVSDDPKIYKTKLMRGLFKLGSQHWAQLLMIGSQYAIDMPPDVRKSVSYVALGREPEMNERKKLYENFGGLAGSFERFCDLMDQITGDYTFLIFKKRSQSNELEECVSWFRTKKLGDWKFGCKEYRDHASKRYDPNYVEQIMM